MNKNYIGSDFDDFLREDVENHYGGELYQKQILGNKVKDLTGRTFNRLTVLSFYDRNKSGVIRWLCRCSCGVEKTIPSYPLLHGTTQSCGCLHREKTSIRTPIIMKNYCDKRRERSREEILSRPIYNRYRLQSKRKNRVFDLTLEEVREIIFSNCFYCGIAPENIFVAHEYSGSILYNGIDRIDNSKGYTKDNCVPCCETCNRAKLMMDYTTFIAWIKRAYLHQFGDTNDQ